MATKKRSPKLDLGESAQKIWLAGLGALSIAEREGSKVFKSLVDIGEDYLGQTRAPVEQAKDRVQGTVESLRRRAGKTVRQVEEALDHGVSTALHRAGVPTRDDVAALTRRVEDLTRKLETLATKPRARRAKRATRPARKTAAR